MDLLEEAIAKLGGQKQVAKFLGCSQPFVSQVRSGLRPLPPLQAAKLAELLEMNPAQAFVEAEIKAAGKEDAASLKRWFQRVAAIIVGAFVVAGASGSWSPISPTYAANANVERTASELPNRYSMRPTFRRVVGRVRLFWRWLRRHASSKAVGRTTAATVAAPYAYA